MLEMEISKVEERDKLRVTSEVLAIQSGHQPGMAGSIIRSRELPEVELENPLLMEDWQREYLYGF